MASINSGSKALRLVTGRRYGSLQAGTGDYQEPFTSTIDTNDSEIYTQANYIPTSSLPFSGSSQNGWYYFASGEISDNINAYANPVLRYWYRHELSETSTDDQSVYFWLDPAITPEDGAAQPSSQTILNNHKTNFISNKYISGSYVLYQSEASNNTTLGYNVTAWYQPNGGSVTSLPEAYFAFDYKTGVLQVNDFSAIPNTSAGENTRIYVTAYQYVGKTLRTKLAELDSTIANLSPGGGGSGAYISSSNGDYIVSASNEGILIKGSYDTTPTNIANISNTSASFGVSVVASAGFTGSLQGTGSWAVVAVSASIADNTATNASYYPVFVTAAGNQGLQIDTATLSYNPSTNVLTTTASSAATASNISTAFVGSTVAPNNQILISNGTGQVTGSGNLSFNAGTLTIGNSATDITISPSVFDVSGNTYTFAFGGINNAIQVTNAANPNTGQITFNLSASFTGPTVFSSANNSTFDDQFILLASGSGTAKDSGIVFEDFNIGPFGTGSVLFADTVGTKRLSYKFTGSIDSTGFNPDAYINMTFIQDGTFTNTSIVDQKIGGDTGAGYMFIDSDGNIYIKA